MIIENPFFFFLGIVSGILLFKLIEHNFIYVARAWFLVRLSARMAIVPIIVTVIICALVFGGIAYMFIPW